jgi:type IV pilus assembly protein PilA
MLTAIKRHLDRDEEEGFTLIELMVVVLIIAILLAIAIPTFLGARNSANSRAAQSNLRNALTAEQTEWTNAQTFDSTTTDMTAIESGISWANGAAGTTVPNQVSAVTGDSGNEVVLQAQGKDGNCYEVVQSDDPATSFTGYLETAGTCAAPTVPSPLAAPASGSASKNLGTLETSW